MAENIDVIERLLIFAKDYGFILLFAILSLLLMAGSISKFIGRWESINKIKIDESSTRHRIELELMQKRTNAEIEQSIKMFNLVTEVQTSQVSQMQTITEVINLLKEEIRDSRLTANNTGEKITILNTHVTGMMDRYENTMESIPKILHNIKDLYKNQEIIMKKLNIMVDILRKDISETNVYNEHE